MAAATSSRSSRRLKDPEYRAHRERLEGPDRIARLIIARRGELGLTQQELAGRMGTTASVISRIESGQHAVNAGTLQRVFEALESRLVVGYEYGPVEDPTPGEAVVVSATPAEIASREVVVAHAAARLDG